jgi:hypothetical protein
MEEEELFAWARREIRCGESELGTLKRDSGERKGPKGLLQICRPELHEATRRFGTARLRTVPKRGAADPQGHPCVQHAHGELEAVAEAPSRSRSKLLRLNAGWGRDRRAARACVGHLQGFGSFGKRRAISVEGLGEGV